MEAVATADEVAVDLLRLAAMTELDLRRLARKAADPDVRALEQDLPAVGEPARDQVLHHLLLAIDGNALADQLSEVDVMQRAIEAEIDAVVHHALALHARADPGLDQHVGRPLLDQPGADARLAIGTAPRFDDDAGNAGTVQEMRQHQSRGACADDADLGAHQHSSPAILPAIARMTMG
jgi:hypothetical protein